jgi:hypothetical protein
VVFVHVGLGFRCLSGRRAAQLSLRILVHGLCDGIVVFSYSGWFRAAIMSTFCALADGYASPLIIIVRSRALG